MRNPKFVIAGVGLAAAAAIGGVSAAVASGSPSHGGAYGSNTASMAPAVPGGGSATVRTATASVGGQNEQILVNSQGLPLYYYQADTATSSRVDPAVVQLWPPLTSASPTGRGVNGALSAVKDSYGSQVAYQGHLLYTFTGDRAGQVTGQGVQDFFVATPGMTALSASAAPQSSAPAAPQGGGYNY
jgi:predicted lipoprotein with Yx(FWY)xxD motif